MMELLHELKNSTFRSTGKKGNEKFTGRVYITKNESFLAYFMSILNSCVV